MKPIIPSVWGEFHAFNYATGNEVFHIISVLKCENGAVVSSYVILENIRLDIWMNVSLYLTVFFPYLIFTILHNPKSSNNSILSYNSWKYSVIAFFWR